MPKRSSKPKRPRDANQLAKAIVDLTVKADEAIKVDDIPENRLSEKNPSAVALGRLGGLKGGKARSKKLTPKQRSDIAKKAALARWNKDKP